ncbi:MAG: transcriptional regulator [Mojavia pulchra JT2-VF2]|jgi:nitrogen regulatory protein PII|uniref:Transcriptional regulator n=1 Tax=Mojavia pulchra JT2-VF2 TaxID=287848 RepID=A0A951Q361_9NOST|nr:transcriptional regulator [Mojavia pulchra JT2-VF2]
MEAAKKIEIVTNSLELQRVLEILEKGSVFGYTVIEDVTGNRDRGRVFNDLETHTLTNGYVISICTEQQEQELVKAIKPVLKKFGGVCIVSDAKCIRH